ncbi:beta-phosphoglucomutase [Spirochaeta isovalerica]|uniref:Beta-phosphoglucomutase n=1 Tax=Spirochaeta isovalerica TaxID=150 RepID=A0A841R6Y5_9SPIO|nr:beta-phosphoglucomutase [Spirochaeta isovalerica]MBB6480984.1 beta-phosphoglucomutase [Spirochaeta isovalerica]
MGERILGIIFDLDGVITDTAEFHYKAWQWLADREGLSFDRTVNEQLRGVSRRKSLEIILKGSNMEEERILRCMDDKNAYYQTLLEGISRQDILPGVEDLLKGIRRRGWKISLASASRNARFILEKLELISFFDGLSDGYSVVRPKPAPDVFIHAAGQLGLPVTQCIVVEDAEAGVKAALEGGMKTVGIGPENRVGAAHIRYDEPGLIALDDLQSLIPG